MELGILTQAGVSLCALACLSAPYREDLLGSVLSELYSGRIKRAIIPPWFLKESDTPPNQAEPLDQISPLILQAPSCLETSSFPVFKKALLKWKWKVPLKLEGLWGQGESSRYLLQGFIYVFVLKLKTFLFKECVSKNKRNTYFFWPKKPGLFVVTCKGVTHWGTLYKRAS